MMVFPVFKRWQIFFLEIIDTHRTGKLLYTAKNLWQKSAMHRIVNVDAVSHENEIVISLLFFFDSYVSFLSRFWWRNWKFTILIELVCVWTGRIGGVPATCDTHQRNRRRKPLGYNAWLSVCCCPPVRLPVTVRHQGGHRSPLWRRDRLRI